MRKDILSLVLMLVAVVMILVCFFGPWYHTHVAMSSGGQIGVTDIYFHLTEAEVSGSLFGGGETSMTISYDDAQALTESESAVSEGMLNIYRVTFFLTIGVIVVSILSLIGIAGVIFNYGKSKTMHKISSVFKILTLLLLLGAIVYFASVYHYEQVKSGSETLGVTGTYGFWSHVTMNLDSEFFDVNMVISTGPDYAWYLLIISFIIVLIAGLLFKKSKADIITTTTPKKAIPTESDKKKPNFCSDCGTSVEGNQKFCPDCGNELK